MLVQVRLECKSLVAPLARVGLGGGVRLDVGAEVGLVSKGALALGTGEGFLPRVRPEVTLEQPGPGEGLAALLALAGQGVGPDVHLEGAGGVVALATIFTSGLSLDLIRTVKLLVLGEP